MKRILSIAFSLAIVASVAAPAAHAQYPYTQSQPQGFWSRLVSKFKPSAPYPEYSLPAYLGLRPAVNWWSTLKRAVRLTPGTPTVMETYR